MASFHKIAATLIALLCSCNLIKGAPDETLVYRICNGDTSTTWAYNDAVSELLQDIVDNTPNNGYSYYSEQHDILTKACYGHGACNGIISFPDCKTCLSDAAKQIQNDCYLSVGAQLQLQDCRIRFEDYKFNED